jgi:hypothetical protein
MVLTTPGKRPLPVLRGRFSPAGPLIEPRPAGARSRAAAPPAHGSLKHSPKAGAPPERAGVFGAAITLVERWGPFRSGDQALEGSRGARRPVPPGESVQRQFMEDFQIGPRPACAGPPGGNASTPPPSSAVIVPESRACPVGPDPFRRLETERDSHGMWDG